jgi:hypothetical protein
MTDSRYYNVRRMKGCAYGDGRSARWQRVAAVNGSWSATGCAHRAGARRVEALIEARGRRRAALPGGDVEILPAPVSGATTVWIGSITTIWPKKERIPCRAIAEIRRMPFVQHLQDDLGGSRSPTRTRSAGGDHWRIVRPDQPGDTGPLHADRWFRTRHGKTAPGVERPWWGCGRLSRAARPAHRPGHRRDWRPRRVQVRLMKPQIDENEDELAPVLVETRPLTLGSTTSCCTARPEPRTADAHQLDHTLVQP